MLRARIDMFGDGNIIMWFRWAVSEDKVIFDDNVLIPINQWQDFIQKEFPNAKIIEWWTEK